MTEKTNGKVSLGNKLAFACGDIFGGGSFNIINFLFTPFLTLVVGIPMVWLFPILLFTKLWDGIIDPFIGMITDAKKPGKFGKRRWFMLVFAPLVCVGMVLLFFPWNLVTDSLALKIALVIICYVFYATAQSFVLIPYYSHASEMTDDFAERNKTNAVRLAFSVASSIICIVVPGMIASPTKGDNGKSYILMASIFGVIFLVSVWITALFSREQIVTPSIKQTFILKEYFKPLKVKTYRQYLGMQMCTSMAMAVMSSFFFIFCDFYLRRNTYQQLTQLNITFADAPYSRFPVATVAAALMFVAQIFALPFYVNLIKRKSKRFAYLFGAVLWAVGCVVMFMLPGDTDCTVNASAKTLQSVGGVPDWLILVFGLYLGFGIGGTVFVPHSSFGDVCDVGELYFGKRTEGAFSGLTNFLNTTAQALGLAIPPLLTGIAGYLETDYLSTDVWEAMSQAEQQSLMEKYAVSSGQGTVKLLPLAQTESAQTAIRIAFAVIPLVILVVGIFIASRYKLTRELQQRIVETNTLDHDSDEYKQQRDELLAKL